MPKLYDMTENINAEPQPSLYEMTNRPRVIINTNEIDKPKENGIISNFLDSHDNINKPRVTTNIAQHVIDKLLGLHGEERYQLWPERLVREGISATHDAMSEGTLNPGLRREDFTDIPAPTEPTKDSTALGRFLNTAPVAWSPADNIIEQGQAASALAGTGGLAGAGREAGVALGSGPVARFMSDKPMFDFSKGTSSGSRSVKIGPTEITYGVNPKNNDVELSLIRTNKNDRGQGYGRAAIEQFLNEADANNKRVLLSANPMDKSTSRSKLVDFYKSLGFEKNSGRNKDFTTRAEFIRNPKLLSDSSKPGAGLNANKPFYSAVENAVAAAKQPKADAQQWLSFLKNQPGVKQEELAHLGLDKLSGSITKDDLLKAVQEGQPQIKEVIKGGEAGTKEKAFELAKEHGWKSWEDIDPSTQAKYMQRASREAGESPTKYHSYQLPGGENYREMLLTLPTKPQVQAYAIRYKDGPQIGEAYASKAEAEAALKEIFPNRKDLEIVPERATDDGVRTGSKPNPDDYKSSHWDEPNVLAHIRMNDRMIDGKKSLHLEEIQSDWHQEGRKKGYREGEKAKIPFDDWFKQTHIRDYEDLPAPAQQRARDEYERFGQNVVNNDARVPDAPFKKTWDELALKKAITHAVKNGYDQISWTPGEAQAARYDLSKHLDSIGYEKRGDNLYNITARDKNDNTVWNNQSATLDQIESHLGKEMAEKIKNGHGDKQGKFNFLTDLNLKVGGQGMKAFYDKMLVDKANAIGKKFGVKVNKSEIPLDTKKPTDFKDFADWEKAKAEGRKQPVFTMQLTPELKDHVLKKGFPLFSVGVPIFTPVDFNPWKKDK